MPDAEPNNPPPCVNDMSVVNDADDDDVVIVEQQADQPAISHLPQGDDTVQDEDDCSGDDMVLATPTCEAVLPRDEWARDKLLIPVLLSAGAEALRGDSRLVLKFQDGTERVMLWQGFNNIKVWDDTDRVKSSSGKVTEVAVGQMTDTSCVAVGLLRFGDSPRDMHEKSAIVAASHDLQMEAHVATVEFERVMIPMNSFDGSKNPHVGLCTQDFFKSLSRMIKLSGGTVLPFKKKAGDEGGAAESGDDDGDESGDDDGDESGEVYKTLKKMFKDVGLHENSKLPVAHRVAVVGGGEDLVLRHKAYNKCLRFTWVSQEGQCTMKSFELVEPNNDIRNELCGVFGLGADGKEVYMCGVQVKPTNVVASEVNMRACMSSDQTPVDTETLIESILPLIESKVVEEDEGLLDVDKTEGPSTGFYPFANPETGELQDMASGVYFGTFLIPIHEIPRYEASSGNRGPARSKGAGGTVKVARPEPEPEALEPSFTLPSLNIGKAIRPVMSMKSIDPNKVVFGMPLLCILSVIAADMGPAPDKMSEKQKIDVGTKLVLALATQEKNYMTALQKACPASKSIAIGDSSSVVGPDDMTAQLKSNHANATALLNGAAWGIPNKKQKK